MELSKNTFSIVTAASKHLQNINIAYFVIFITNILLPIVSTWHILIEI